MGGAIPTVHLMPSWRVQEHSYINTYFSVYLLCRFGIVDYGHED